MPPEEVAEGFLRIAIENMANAIKKISVQRGYDVSGYMLNCFGGAGGQHACLVADALGMETIFLHPFAGVLSAYGMGLADIVAMREQQIDRPLDGGERRRRPQDRCRRFMKRPRRDRAARASTTAGSRSAPESISAMKAASRRFWSMLGRRRRNDSADFEAQHKKRFGFMPGDAPLLIEAVSVEAVGKPGGRAADRRCGRRQRRRPSVARRGPDAGGRRMAQRSGL